MTGSLVEYIGSRVIERDTAPQLPNAYRRKHRLADETVGRSREGSLFLSLM
jgi:hypothetical protein